ncbi:hypothetical protein SD77_0381 [Bacillus badius]|uniref:Ribose 5-phosphate isomerase B n=1 Tax=Bacillus badius TaxID=1455 RepID=A0ABR5B0N6_BACBA|nr:hypothetical protein SD78_3713 [Bacillus badius]KIL80533.1 hypothetical protein SD77_0381 [Bacillus badius]
MRARSRALSWMKSSSACAGARTNFLDERAHHAAANRFSIEKTG